MHADAAVDASPRLCIISSDIRRDLVVPMRHFSRVELHHLYRHAPYLDMGSEDFDPTLEAYSTPSQLAKLLKLIRPDIVQNLELLSFYQLPYVLTVFRYASRHRCCLYAGVHIGRPIWEKYGRIPALLLRELLQPILHNTHFLFYLNEGGKHNLEWLRVPEEKLVRHMYGTWGVDPREYTPERSPHDPSWGDHPTLLYVGRLDAEKGLFDLIKAFTLVRTSVPDVRLVLIGDGPHRKQLEQEAKDAGHQKQIDFLGTVRNSRIPSYLRASTVFVSPAITTRKWEEYVGMTNIQAMACGVPVVSTLSGAIPEYVPDGEAGILVPERNPEALAEAIQRLLDDNELRTKLGRQARLYATEHYNAQLNVLKAEQIILDRCYSPGSQSQKRDTY